MKFRLAIKVKPLSFERFVSPSFYSSFERDFVTYLKEINKQPNLTYKIAKADCGRVRPSIDRRSNKDNQQNIAFRRMHNPRMKKSSFKRSFRSIKFGVLLCLVYLVLITHSRTIVASVCQRRLCF